MEEKQCASFASLEYILVHAISAFLVMNPPKWLTTRGGINKKIF
jgi:hypothetical protein